MLVLKSKKVMCYLVNMKIIMTNIKCSKKLNHNITNGFMHHTILKLIWTMLLLSYSSVNNKIKQEKF